MASLPPQASHRRSSPAEPSSSASSSDHEVTHNVAQPERQSQSTNKDNTQSLILDQSSGMHFEDGTAEQSASNALEAAKEREPRHCWICLQDEGDEGSDNLEWRSPCPCNLQAHEECMLEWIADLEAPNTRKGRLPGKILCPQCKAEIRVDRPRDIIVATVDLLNGIGRLLILPTGLGAVLGCLYSGSLAYGMNAVYLVSGGDYGWEYFMKSREYASIFQLLLGQRIHRSMLKVFRITDPFMPISGPADMKVYLGLPLIAPALILSRTSLADNAFAVLPITVSQLSGPVRIT
jgi:hypothetical protein